MIAVFILIGLFALIGFAVVVFFFVFLTECIKDAIEDANRNYNEIDY